MSLKTNLKVAEYLAQIFKHLNQAYEKLTEYYLKSHYVYYVYKEN